MKSFIIFLFLTGWFQAARAQFNPLKAELPLRERYTSLRNSPLAKYIPPDTLYFCLDTAVAAKGKPVVKIIDGGDDKKFAIYCDCMRDYDKNIYLLGIPNRRTTIDRNKLKRLKTRDLSALVSFMQDMGYQQFTNRYRVFIIEPLNKGYLVNQVFNACGDIMEIE